jgi:prepilin-type N-terminal cleavage/methylation domain-containing protein
MKPPPLCNLGRGTKTTLNSPSGFSLIELIGVLAILSIAALALAPLFVTKVRLATAATEEVTLSTLAEGLKLHIQKVKEIPDQTIWISAIARDLGWEATKVGINEVRFPRIYLIDPAFRIGASNGVLTYRQQLSTGSVIRPISPRLMILSSLSTQPLPLGSGTNSAFNNIWTNASDTVPSSLSSWNGRADELKVQRINLSPLFHRVIVRNNDAGPTRITLGATDTGDLTTITNANTFDRYLITGTAVGLIGTNLSPEFKEIVRRDTVYVWERNKWRGQIFDGFSNFAASPLVQLFMEGVDQFLAATNCLNHAPYRTNLINNIQTFFDVYCAWAGNAPVGFTNLGPIFCNIRNAQRGLIIKQLLSRCDSVGEPHGCVEGWVWRDNDNGLFEYYDHGVSYNWWEQWWQQRWDRPGHSRRYYYFEEERPPCSDNAAVQWWEQHKVWRGWPYNRYYYHYNNEEMPHFSGASEDDGAGSDYSPERTNGLQGIVIKLTGPDGIIKTTSGGETNRGHYAFCTLPPGKYTVEVVLPQSVTQGSVTNRGTYVRATTANRVHVVVVEGVTNRVHFGLRKP